MPTPPRTRKSTRAKSPPQRAQRHSDAIGIVLIALALVTVFALWAGNGGLIGDGLANVFRTLVGQAAWAIPVVIGLAGVSFLAGKTKAHVSRISVGAVLVFLGIVGFFARARANEWFDPELVSQSGGYIGAVVAWAFHTLLGNFMAIGFIATSLVGLALSLDSPLHSLAAALAERRRQAKVEPPKKAVPEAKAAIKAVVKMPDDVVASEPGPAF